ncbi:MAG: MBL fold metallo-hydrolase [Bacteroidota bacterium]|nr:MBL fold metallo-hydrolase [Bacteroidota bacterium]
MKITLWGVRGSIQTSGPDTKNYGSRTSCAFVSEEDNVLILDAGSGIQQFNSINFSQKRIDVLLTHLHMDHILGLGFFSPFFDPTMEAHIWGPKIRSESLRSRLSRYLSPPLFPVLLRDLPCKLIFHEIGNTDFEINNFKITSNYVIHQGPTVGFRVAGSNSVFTYIPDHEPALGCGGMIKDPKWISGFNLAFDTDLLYHDGQYTAEEYKNKKGWGHSGIEDALLFASIARVKNLIIAHHDPSHSDEQLSQIFKDIQLKTRGLFKYEMAEEGMEFDLP